MKTLKEIIEERQFKKDAKKSSEHIVSGIGESNKKNSVATTSAIVAALEDMKTHWSSYSQDQQDRLMEAFGAITQEIPAPELSINFNGLKKIDVKTMSVEGLTDVLSEVVEYIKKVEETVKNVQFTVPQPNITVPEVKLPTINVPKPEVTVNVPAPIVKMPEIKFPKPEKVEEKEELPKKISIERGKFGIDKITEQYKGGTVIFRRVGSDWVIDDNR